MTKWRERIVESIAQGRLPRLRDRLSRRRRRFAGEIQDMADLLCFSAEPVEPPVGLRARILHALQHPADKGHRVVSTEARRWRFLLPGIEICMLSRAEGHRSVLLKIKAGHALPAHRHRRIEQAMILEGSCLSGRTHLKSGDFFIADAGTRHEPVRAIEDCVILVIAHK